jgi:hypothetical protein
MIYMNINDFKYVVPPEKRFELGMKWEKSSALYLEEAENIMRNLPGNDKARERYKRLWTERRLSLYRCGLLNGDYEFTSNQRDGLIGDLKKYDNENVNRIKRNLVGKIMYAVTAPNRFLFGGFCSNSATPSWFDGMEEKCDKIERNLEEKLKAEGIETGGCKNYEKFLSDQEKQKRERRLEEEEKSQGLESEPTQETGSENPVGKIATSLEASAPPKVHKKEAIDRGGRY